MYHIVLFPYGSRTSRSNEDVTRAVEARDAVKHASDALRQIVECISFQAATSETHVNTLRLRRGMSSLPDEILSIILEYAAYCDKSHYRYEDESAIKTVKAATILSHGADVSDSSWCEFRASGIASSIPCLRKWSLGAATALQSLTQRSSCVIARNRVFSSFIL